MADLVAQFTSSIRTGVAPLTVNFTNTSTGPYTSVRWDFGDTAQSNLINPWHQYVSDGVYQVTLTIFDAESGQASTNTTITVFADSDASTSATTQQALFTTKRFTAGQVSVRKTLTDGSTVETEFPLSSMTGDFNLEVAGNLILPFTATTVEPYSEANSYNLGVPNSIYPEIYVYEDEDFNCTVGLFMATGGTGADISCSGHQLFMYDIVNGTAGADYITLDRKIPLLSGDTATTTFRCFAIFSLAFKLLASLAFNLF